MNPRHKISPAGIELIKSFEGYRRRAAQLPDGRWTIGYGHTKSAREGAEVTEADATALLTYDLMAVTAAVNDFSFTPLTQNQFDALVSFAFNVGVESFRKSTVLRRINEGSMLQAACSFEMWRKAEFEGERIVVDALVRRRAAEKALFLTPTNGWVPAPSPVLRPRIDYDVCASVPKLRPVDLTTTLDGETTVLVREDEPDTAPVAHEPPESDDGEPEAAEPAHIALAEPVAPPLVAPVLAAVVTDVTAFEPAPEPAAPETVPAQSAPIRYEPLAPPPVFVPAPRVVTDTRSDFEMPSPPVQDPFPAVAANQSYEPAAAPPVAEPAFQHAEPELFERPSPPAPWPGYQAAEEAPVDEAPTAVAASADLFDRPIYRHEETEVEETHDLGGEDIRPLEFKGAPLIIMFLVGLMLFAGAMFWGLHARPSGGVVSPVIIGMISGLVGIGLTGTAVFMVVKRLGAREE
jgi:lysozyme